MPHLPSPDRAWTPPRPGHTSFDSPDESRQLRLLPVWTTEFYRGILWFLPWNWGLRTNLPWKLVETTFFTHQIITKKTNKFEDESFLTCWNLRFLPPNRNMSHGQIRISVSPWSIFHQHPPHVAGESSQHFSRWYFTIQTDVQRSFRPIIWNMIHHDHIYRIVARTWRFWMCIYFCPVHFQLLSKTPIQIGVCTQFFLALFLLKSCVLCISVPCPAVKNIARLYDRDHRSEDFVLEASHAGLHVSKHRGRKEGPCSRSVHWKGWYRDTLLIIIVYIFPWKVL